MKTLDYKAATPLYPKPDDSSSTRMETDNEESDSDDELFDYLNTKAKVREKKPQKSQDEIPSESNKHNLGINQDKDVHTMSRFSHRCDDVDLDEDEEKFIKNGDEGVGNCIINLELEAPLTELNYRSCNNSLRIQQKPISLVKDKIPHTTKVGSESQININLTACKEGHLSKAANTSLSKASNTFLSKAAKTSLSKAANTTLSEAANTTLSEVANTTLSSAAITYLSEAANTTLSKAANTSLFEAANASLSEAVKTSLSEAANTSLSEAVKTSLSEAAKTSLNKVEATHTDAKINSSFLQADFSLERKEYVGLVSCQYKDAFPEISPPHQTNKEVFIPTQYKFVRSGNKLCRVAVTKDGSKPLPEANTTSIKEHPLKKDDVDTKFSSRNWESDNYCNYVENGSQANDVCAIDIQECKEMDQKAQFCRTDLMVIDEDKEIVKETDNDFVEYLENTCWSENASTSSQVSLCSNESPIFIKVGPGGKLSECSQCPASATHNDHKLQEKKVEMDFTFLERRIQRLEHDLLEIKRSSVKSEIKDHSDKIDRCATAEQSNAICLQSKQTSSTNMNIETDSKILDHVTDNEKIAQSETLSVQSHQYIDPSISNVNSEPTETMQRSAICSENRICGNKSHLVVESLSHGKIGESLENRKHNNNDNEGVSVQTFPAVKGVKADCTLPHKTLALVETEGPVNHDATSRGNIDTNVRCRANTQKERTCTFSRNLNVNACCTKPDQLSSCKKEQPEETFVATIEKTVAINSDIHTTHDVNLPRTVDDQSVHVLEEETICKGNEQKDGHTAKDAEMNANSFQYNNAKLVQRTVNARKRNYSSKTRQSVKKPRREPCAERKEGFKSENNLSTETDLSENNFLTYDENFLQKLYQQKLEEVKQIQLALKEKKRSQNSRATQDETGILTQSSKHEPGVDADCHIEAETIGVGDVNFTKINTCGSPAGNVLGHSVGTDSTDLDIVDIQSDTCTNKGGNSSGAKYNRVSKSSVNKTSKRIQEGHDKTKDGKGTRGSTRKRRSLLKTSADVDEKSVKQKKRRTKVLKTVTWDKADKTEIGRCDQTAQGLGLIGDSNSKKTMNSLQKVCNTTLSKSNKSQTSLKIECVKNGDFDESCEITNTKTSEKKGQKISPKKNKTLGITTQTSLQTKGTNKSAYNNRRKVKDAPDSPTTITGTSKSASQKKGVKRKNDRITSSVCNRDGTLFKDENKSVELVVKHSETSSANYTMSYVEENNTAQVETKRQLLETKISNQLNCAKQSDTKDNKREVGKRKSKPRKLPEKIQVSSISKSTLNNRKDVTKPTLKGKGILQQKQYMKTVKTLKACTSAKRSQKRSRYKTKVSGTTDPTVKGVNKKPRKPRKKHVNNLRSSDTGHVCRMAFEKSCDYTWKEKLQANAFSLNVIDKQRYNRKPLNVKKIIKKILVQSDSSELKLQKTVKHRKRRGTKKSALTADSVRVLSDSDEANHSVAFVSFPGIKLSEMCVQYDSSCSIADGANIQNDHLLDRNEITVRSLQKLNSVDCVDGCVNKHDTSESFVLQNNFNKGVDGELRNTAEISLPSPSKMEQLYVQTSWSNDNFSADSDSDSKKASQMSPGNPKFSKTFGQIKSLLVRRDKKVPGSTAVQNLQFTAIP